MLVPLPRLQDPTRPGQFANDRPAPPPGPATPGRADLAPRCLPSAAATASLGTPPGYPAPPPPLRAPRGSGRSPPRQDPAPPGRKHLPQCTVQRPPPRPESTEAGMTALLVPAAPAPTSCSSELTPHTSPPPVVAPELHRSPTRPPLLQGPHRPNTCPQAPSPPPAAAPHSGLRNYPIPPRRLPLRAPLLHQLAAPHRPGRRPRSPPIVPAPAPSPPSHCPRPRSPPTPPPSPADRTAQAPQASPCTQTTGPPVPPPAPAASARRRLHLHAPQTLGPRLSEPVPPLPPPRKASQSPPPPRRPCPRPSRPRRHGPRAPGGDQPAPGPATPARSRPEKGREEHGSGRGVRARIRPAGSALLTDSCSIRVHFRAARTRSPPGLPRSTRGPPHRLFKP